MFFVRFKDLQGFIFAGKDGDPFPNFGDFQDIPNKPYGRNNGQLATNSLKAPLGENQPSEGSAVNRFLMFPKTAVRLKQAGHLDYNAGDLSVGHTPAPLHAGQKSRPNQPGKKRRPA